MIIILLFIYHLLNLKTYYICSKLAKSKRVKLYLATDLQALPHKRIVHNHYAPSVTADRSQRKYVLTLFRNNGETGYECEKQRHHDASYILFSH